MIVSLSVVRFVVGVSVVAGLRVVLAPAGGWHVASSAFIIRSSLSGIGGTVRAERFFAVMVDLLHLHRGLGPCQDLRVSALVPPAEHDVVVREPARSVSAWTGRRR
jgi:hypothetical protein